MAVCATWTLPLRVLLHGQSPLAWRLAWTWANLKVPSRIAILIKPLLGLGWESYTKLSLFGAPIYPFHFYKGPTKLKKDYIALPADPNDRKTEAFS